MCYPPRAIIVKCQCQFCDKDDRGMNPILLLPLFLNWQKFRLFFVLSFWLLVNFFVSRDFLVLVFSSFSTLRCPLFWFNCRNKKILFFNEKKTKKKDLNEVRKERKEKSFFIQSFPPKMNECLTRQKRWSARKYLSEFFCPNDAWFELIQKPLLG